MPNAKLDHRGLFLAILYIALIVLLFLSACVPSAPPPVAAGLTSQAPASQAAAKTPYFDDDDGSADGTSALLYLLTRPEVDLKGAGISYGEAHPDVYIQHIGRWLDQFGFPNVPLGAGPDNSLSGNNQGFPEWLRQSSNKFWGLTVPNAQKTYPVQTDADLIISVVKSSPAPVTLFFSGPLTNLALALRKAPEIRDHIAAVTMMGGAVYVPGNVHDFYPSSPNTYAEWNVYADPVAAKEVFDSGLKISIVPLDATNQVQVTRSDTAGWRKGGKIGNLAADLYDGMLKSSGKGTYIWDLMASAVMLEPALCAFQPLHIDVITEPGDHFGQTAVVANKAPNINVCLKPDAPAIRQKLSDAFSASR
jgi:pyrimidine-specific ribonucleoside hydrolase